MFLAEFSDLELKGASQKEEHLTLRLKLIVFVFLLSYFAYRGLSRSIDWAVEAWKIELP